MKRRSLILLALPLLLVFAAAGWYLYLTCVRSPAPAAPASTPMAGAHGATVDGEPVVIVPLDMQRASGIAVTPLAATRVQPELLAYASVIDLQPLIALGTRLAAARSELDAARSQADASAAQAARMEALFQDERNVSQKSLQEARAAARADQARLAASDAALAGTMAGIRLQYGDALAWAARSPGSSAWRTLLEGQAAVLRVVLPAGVAAPESLMFDAPAGGRLAARRLSAAPQVDPMLQGAAYFYLAAAPLPSGTRTVAHIARAATGVAGVVVPDAAIVWYGGARWAYVRTAAERFTRRLVQALAPVEGGVLAAAGLRPGDEVVTRGASLLLSEEQRPRGVATSCKDPPECDD